MKTHRIVLWNFLTIVLITSHARAQQAPAPAPTVKLADLVAEAEQKDPGIRAAGRMVDAKHARVPQARALPDPQLSIGYMGDFAPFQTQANDPASYRQFGLMQEIPYPGKRDLRGKIAEKDVDAEQWNLEAARRYVRAQVKLAYYELWAVDRALETAQKDKDLLETFAAIAAERYKVGKGLQQDVLRAQVEVTRILQRFTVLRQRRLTLEARLNSLLQRPPDAPLGSLEPVEKSPFAFTLDELLDKAVANAPEIRREDQRIEQSQYAIHLAKKEYYPDFGVGWDYQNRGSGQRDMYGLRFTLNLPIFYKSKQREALGEASSTLAANREMRDAARTAILFQVKEQYLAARASEELLTLYRKGMVPQSSLALESALAAYQVGSLDFLSLLTDFTTVLDYETSYYEELANFQKALVRIEQITGLEIAK
jgi:cobalt-zinc-cadmium efflux system outer membrane protein